MKERLAIAVMHCEKCVANVTKHFAEINGVDSVDVDLDGQWADVSFDPDKVTMDMLLHALDDTNFKVAPMPESGRHPFADAIAKDAKKKAEEATAAAEKERLRKISATTRMLLCQPKPRSALRSKACTALTARLQSRATTERPPA